MKSWAIFLLLSAIASPCMGSVSIATTSIPNGTVNTPYSAVINAPGGCTPYIWAVTSGALPAGVAMKPPANGTILTLTGTPTTAKTYSFTIQATGCGKHTSSVSYKITIQAGANHVVDLNWKASTSNNISGYNVYRSPDGSSWKKVNVSVVASTLYSDSTVANGSTYYYSVTAVNISGQESSKSGMAKAVVP